MNDSTLATREQVEASSFTVSTVCLRRYDLAKALQVARDLGFSSVDLVGLRGLAEHVPVLGSTQDFRAAAEVFRASGLRASSLNTDPGSYDANDDAADVQARITRTIDFANEVGAPLIVLPAGEKRATHEDAPDYTKLADGMNAAAALGQAAGVRIAIEAPYFGRPIDRLERTAHLSGLLDPSIELAFDVSHIEAADESVTDAWQQFAARIGVVHLRDAVSGNIRRVIGAGRVDFAAAFAAIDASSYGGDIVLELETLDSPFASKEDEILAAVSALLGARGAAA